MPKTDLLDAWRDVPAVTRRQLQCQLDGAYAALQAKNGPVVIAVLLRDTDDAPPEWGALLILGPGTDDCQDHLRNLMTMTDHYFTTQRDWLELVATYGDAVTKR